MYKKIYQTLAISVLAPVAQSAHRRHRSPGNRKPSSGHDTLDGIGMLKSAPAPIGIFNRSRKQHRRSFVLAWKCPRPSADSLLRKIKTPRHIIKRSGAVMSWHRCSSDGRRSAFGARKAQRLSRAASSTRAGRKIIALAISRRQWRQPCRSVRGGVAACARHIVCRGMI